MGTCEALTSSLDIYYIGKSEKGILKIDSIYRWVGRANLELGTYILVSLGNLLHEEDGHGIYLG
jgi:hypothetical protein